jgi:hypothetical protein
MLITQILAAHWAGINQLVFHTQTDEHNDDIEKAKTITKELLRVKEVKEVIEKIVGLHLEWEKSNNT